jgi:hypothetical protein
MIDEIKKGKWDGKIKIKDIPSILFIILLLPFVYFLFLLSKIGDIIVKLTSIKILDLNKNHKNLLNKINKKK